MCCIPVSLELFYEILKCMPSFIFFVNKPWKFWPVSKLALHWKTGASWYILQYKLGSLPGLFLSPLALKESRRSSLCSTNASWGNYFFTCLFANSPSAIFFYCLLCPVAFKYCTSKNSLGSWRIFHSFSKQIPSYCFCEITSHVYMYIHFKNLYL